MPEPVGSAALVCGGATNQGPEQRPAVREGGVHCTYGGRVGGGRGEKSFMFLAETVPNSLFSWGLHLSLIT